MNIFVLDPDPAICASLHCDQHLHKMILESAQMLSTIICQQQPSYARYVYAPTHANHTCTRWVAEDTNNAAWLLHLMTELDNIRQSLGCDEHKSMEIAKVYLDLNPELAGCTPPESFVFAGPVFIAIRDCPITEKYQAYYRLKMLNWLVTKNPMTYKGRTVPSFLTQE